MVGHARDVSGLIAIVGRPNVGKSALFNRIAGRRIAIVHDQPGVTRDRVTAQAEWHGQPYTLVDTGGIGLLRREKSEDVIVKAAVEQVQIAIDSASVIIFVVNVQEGITPVLDYDPAIALGVNSGTAAPNLWPLFDAVGATPILVIRGETSDILSAETLAEMTRRMPHIMVQIVPNRGHAPTLGELTARMAIRKFLAALR